MASATGDVGGLAAMAAVSTGGPLDTTLADRKVWLLKVPTLVGDTWQKEAVSAPKEGSSNGGPLLGKIICTFDPLSRDPDATQVFSLELKGKEAANIPKSYSLNVVKDAVPMHIFSDSQGKLVLEGKIEHSFNINANGTDIDDYRKLCRDRLNKSMVKTRTLQVLQNDRGMITPLPSTWSIQKDKKRIAAAAAKGPEGKRTRRERGELEDIVFKLFERQTNWALKQLVQETDQPVAFLKEILNDLCIYNKRGTNQGTYELKPEFRRASTAEEAAEPAE